MAIPGICELRTVVCMNFVDNNNNNNNNPICNTPDASVTDPEATDTDTDNIFK